MSVVREVLRQAKKMRQMLDEAGEAPPPDLVVAHELTPTRAKTVAERGSPNPSIATRVATESPQEFGEVTLFAKPEKILNAPGAKTYTNDVFGVRHPWVNKDGIFRHPITDKEMDYTPQAIVDVTTEVGDVLTEGGITAAKEGVGPTIARAIANQAIEGIRSVDVIKRLKPLLAYDKGKATLAQKKWIRLKTREGDHAGMMVAAVMRGMQKGGVRGIERAIAEVAAEEGVKPEALRAAIFDRGALSDVEEVAHALYEQAGREYFETRPHRLVGVGEGKDFDVAIVPVDPHDPSFDEAAAALEAAGAEVYRVPRDGEGYITAYREVMKKLKAKGYTFGKAGAYITAAAAAGEATLGDEAVASTPEDVGFFTGRMKQRKGVNDSAPAVPPAGFYKRKLMAGPQARQNATTALVGPSTQEQEVTPAGLQRLIMDESSGRDYLSAYKDSRGISTIGHGFNLEEPSNAKVFKDITGYTVKQAIKGEVTITKEQQDQLLQHSVSVAQKDARQLVKNFDQLPAHKQDAITNFVFNVGLTTALKFKNTFAAINKGDWKAAAKGIRGSLYAKQVGARAERIAQALESEE